MTIMAMGYNPDSLETVFIEKKYQIDEAGPMGPMGVLYALRDPDGMKGSLIVTQSDGMVSVDDPTLVIDWDGEWLHASIAFTDRYPTYEELALLHRGVFGRRRFSYQCFVPEDKHVNIHSHALHLWGRVDGRNELPAFGDFGTI